MPFAIGGRTPLVHPPIIRADVQRSVINGEKADSKPATTPAQQGDQSPTPTPGK